MKTSIRSLLGRAPAAFAWDNRQPIREELFGVERMEEHARSLARAQPVASGSPRGLPLAGRLADNAAALLDAHLKIAKAIDEGRAITPAAEWLIDNYHLVDRQIREIRSDLPPGYYRQLPKLADGPFAGYPRVFGIAWAFVAHADSRFDGDMLCRFVRAYQEVQPLMIGELWAVSITLRIVLVENLRRLAGRIVDSYVARQDADRLADRLLGVGEHAPEPAQSVLADIEHMLLPDAFAVELIHRLHDQDPKVTPVLTWLDQRLISQGTTAEAVVRKELQRQGSGSVTVRNIITSMRSISDVDWSDLFERTSLVDDALAVCKVYLSMDFPTRNLYRSAIENLARGSSCTEIEIAERAVAAAQSASCSYDGVIDERQGDPGYYLLAGGRPAFEKGIGFTPGIRAWFGRKGRALGIRGYAGAGLIMAAAILAIPLFKLASFGVDGLWLCLMAVAGIIPAIDLSVAILNQILTRAFGATLLPALDLSNGVPSHLRTLVAVPTMLTTSLAIEEQIERLEVHHLASLEGDLHFALLSDWTDATHEHEADDDELLALAIAGIAKLNERYGAAPGGARFLLFHRRRVWNESEQCWIGWERKRGKLHELNRLLRGATDTTFITTGSNAPVDVHYVITLDADTRLPRDAVRRLIGKMAHPLNRPRFDKKLGRVVEGYAILQPRVTPSLPVAREGSLFQRVFSSMNGIDPYGSAISDVYQDLFGEGSYAGKGIYHVDCFEDSLANRVPDSTLLSHDLFEGIFAHAGLASDVEVVEEFPARYDVAMSRHHRWARGDWQLLPWILGCGPRGDGDHKFNAISAMGRWKMLDNLRRTLSAPALIFALIVGWSLPLHAAALWTLFIMATMLLPSFFPIVTAILPAHPEITMRSHFSALMDDLGLALLQSALLVILLANQAWSMADAIMRTLVRLLVTRRQLLEWTPAAQAALGRNLDLVSFYRHMVCSVVIALLTLAASLTFGTGTWMLALPFVIGWAFAPMCARWISRPPHIAGHISVTPDDAKALRLTARKTWRFFETFVTPLDNMLPPDNYQEDIAMIAHRTSPTNLGLYLLSAVSAHDFGWIGRIDLAERLDATLSSMSKLARFHGHFYNWYDTQDMRVLEPPYISSVDSGNLAGHLIAIANACQEWSTAPSDTKKCFSSLTDTLTIVCSEVERLSREHQTHSPTWHQLNEAIDGFATLLYAAAHRDSFAKEFTELEVRAETISDIFKVLSAESGVADPDLIYWIDALSLSIASHHRDVINAQSLTERLVTIATKARSMALEMDYKFLFDDDRKLLSIGYLVTEGKLDPSCYDLLASEARLASFFAIAKGDIPARHWFRLGRAVTPIAGGAALISWSGSMFEYLMPSLVMRAPAGSLIEQTNRLIVHQQRAYATKLGIPWGISESAYNARDIELTYQYSNFGVPGLGLKRGLESNTVIAPYATALASMVNPQAAVENLTRLTAEGSAGRYGFYEALDYTRSRVPEGRQVEIVRAFMAHHQGMTIVAIANTLLDGVMRTRFHADPMMQATELLLQERSPREVASVAPWMSEVKPAPKSETLTASGGRRLTATQCPTPVTQLLSNGRYTVMMTAVGSGYTRWGDHAITRWREDATCDDWGSYVFLRDVDSGAVWSTGFQPAGIEPDTYEVIFNEDRAQYTRVDGTLTTLQEIVVSAEDDAEVRRVSITNSGLAAREIEITSYSEIVLAPQAADIAHPAFSKLFVVTEYLANESAILATRRRRSPEEPEIWAAHLAVLDGEAVGKAEVETDRARFIGRNRDLRTAISTNGAHTLSGTVGVVLDPIFAQRRRVRIAPGATMRIAFWTMAASTRQDLLDLIDKHRDVNAFERASALAWTQAQVQLRHLGVSPSEAGYFQRLAGHLLYATSTLRPSSETILRGAGTQSSLWPYGISGDVPILLLRISETEDLDIVHEVLQAFQYLKMKQLAVDIVILNDRSSSYVQDLQIAIETLVRTNQSRLAADHKRTAGSIFVLRSDLMSADARALLISVSRVVLVGRRGRLSDQLEHASGSALNPAPVIKRPKPVSTAPSDNAAMTRELEFFNGLGGFSDDGREYVTILQSGQTTPAPWINVIANTGFGFQVGVEGGGCTWSGNARENQLTPWSNDPVSDRSGEAFYIRDADTGDLWSATASPIRNENATYIARHGRGYSRFSHTSYEIAVDLTQFVSLCDPIKISRLRLRNHSSRVRRLDLTAYAEWVLGPSRQASAAFVTTTIDQETGALFAQNLWNGPFGSKIAFADMENLQDDWTGDRTEFIGRNGTLRQPEALVGQTAFSKSTGAGLDPCCAMRTTVKLQPGESIEIAFFLGQAANTGDARALITRYRAADLDIVEREIETFWTNVLGKVQVKTPDRSMDIMLNGWLLYQTIACRIWARSAFYQSSGAYGFRDQLQDGTAVLASSPAMVRQHLLHAASRQFIEGDVQHWWLPHSGQGIRTHFSDDRVWLAYIAAHYIQGSGDDAVLDEIVAFLEGPKLGPNEHDAYFQPTISDTSASLYEHCALALDCSLASGGHGLPLIGTGDWNDGMNRVGACGDGESVWLGWLLLATLNAFGPLAEARGDAKRAVTWRAHASALEASLDREAWDGEWYRRGWFDDGSPLGSAASIECQIDSIAQSWAVLSGSKNIERATQAMASAGRELVRPQDGVALLFRPPFDKTPLDPGYIKGYPPGIRENGGQYTHAALWSVMALAELGQGDKAVELFAMLNPINHARTRADVHRYKVEPYVVAADVYSIAPHVGRGGWTWYTGSAGWMQRAGIESILGLRIEGTVLCLDPCLPTTWPEARITFLHGAARYEIVIENPEGHSRGVVMADLDGVTLNERPLRIEIDDREGVRHLRVRL
ncbi:MAG: glucoamylase family protein [Parvibaculum sp.]|nr:glucoamylase family protein [Parvibaculum sp.]